MAQFKTRVRKTLPNDPVFRAGYDQGQLDITTAVLTYFEQRFISDEDRPEKGTPEYEKFLENVRELSRFLKDERKKAQARVDPAN